MIAAPPPPKKEERSEKETITCLQSTVSASRLALFLQCRLKYYFRYVLKLHKPKTPSLHLGSSVHAALTAWNKARWLKKPLTLKEVYDTYLTAWADNSEGPIRWDPGEEEADKTTGWRLLDTYLRESHVPAEVKPEAVEVPVEADLKHKGLPKLVGILDLVQRGRIIDYKTSSTTPNPEKVQQTNEIQTTSYSILFRANTGKIEEGLELHHLVKLKNPKIVITSLPPMTPQQETRLYRQMESYVNGIQRYDFVPSPSPMSCASCEYFNECRKWH
jgi:putative RecB family exonuclease